MKLLMIPKKLNILVKYGLMTILITLINGCNSVILNPKGNIGLAQKSLIITSFSLMLLIVVPVLLMTIYFTWTYRENNKNVKYNPNWSFSKKIEYTIWIVPILIIIFLAILTYKTTKLLDPSKPLISNKKNITIEVISTDWKWLFIYPEQNIATINEIAFPVNTPVTFKLTSNSVMNSFFIPCLGSQIYAMAGMQTKLNLIANEPNVYKGISANYSGEGFSGMKFKVIATSNYLSFYQWIKKVKLSPNTINNIDDFEKIAKPSAFNTTEYFSSVKPNLFKDVIKKFNNNPVIKHKN